MKFLVLYHNYLEHGTFFRAFQLGKYMVQVGHTVVLMLVSSDKTFGLRRYNRDGVWIIECHNFLFSIAPVWCVIIRKKERQQQ